MEIMLVDVNATIKAVATANIGPATKEDLMEDLGSSDLIVNRYILLDYAEQRAKNILQWWGEDDALEDVLMRLRQVPRFRIVPA